jgi:hypothetical protein
VKDPGTEGITLDGIRRWVYVRAKARVRTKFLNSSPAGTAENGPAEALQREGVPGQLIGKEFQGDKAAQFLVLRLVDDSHATAA